MDVERLKQQIAFLLESDKLKNVIRQSWNTDQSRHENDAEHSWHVALAAMVLSEHCNETELDLARVLRMLLVHDLVEIDAGDTPVYDEGAARDKVEREQQAARRIFGMLPSGQRSELQGLWEEFEERESPEARFAAAIDRLLPLLLNCATEGKAWWEHKISFEQALATNSTIEDGSQALWDFVQQLLHDAVAGGLFPPKEDK